MSTAPAAPAAEDLSPDRSVGGPLLRLLHRWTPGEPFHRSVGLRLAAVAAIGWLPLALLSYLRGPGAGVPFLLDLEVHLRLLVCVPLLAVADRVAVPRLANAVRQLAERGIVRLAERDRLEAYWRQALAARDSLALELGVFAVVITLGRWLWREQVALGTPTWYLAMPASGPELTAAGRWYVVVCTPLFQFLIFLWYARIALWARFLWQVSRLDLRLTATHPDRAGGIGFVGNSALAFSSVLAAQGVLLAGMLANRIFHEGRALASFKVDVAGLVALALSMLLVPLLVFTPRLVAAKRRALREYGELASRYVHAFDEKWVRETRAGQEPLLGSADLQSLADLGNSYAVVREMRSVPFGARVPLQLALVVLAPLAPLLLTAFPVEELLDRLLQLAL